MAAQKIVNVASVKHRSPFRYPGGKTWLVPRIRAWLSTENNCDKDFIEPFAGGAIVGLSVAFEQLARHVTLVELDERVAAVWKTIIETEHGPWLADQIRAFNLTTENIDALLATKEPTLPDRAFQTIVLNRINRGGILASGAGRVKHGENGRGLRSRWYPDTLSSRIHAITAIRDRLTFVHGDGLNIIQANMTREDVIFFVDPPYTASSKKPGSRLYDHAELDHERLFQTLSQAAGDVLMTYDNDDDVRALADAYNFDYETIPMKTTHHAKLTELLIGKNLHWLRS